MNRKLTTIAVLLALWSLSGIAGEPTTDPALNFAGVQWIWYSSDPSVTPQNFPEATSYYRSALNLPATAKIKSAQILVTADNLYVVYVNGKLAGESESNPNMWNVPKTFDLADLLTPGKNSLAIEATNTAPGPAGLILKVVVNLADGQKIERASDTQWRCTDQTEKNWSAANFEEKNWQPPQILGAYGMPPWGRFADGGARRTVAKRPKEISIQATASLEMKPPADYAWPEGVAFLGDDCSLYRPLGGTGTSIDSLNVTIFNPRKTRAFPEHDLPAPMKLGHKLLVMKPARPDVTPQVLIDAGKGAIGSPSVSFDGKTVFVSMVLGDEKFFHIYKISASGGTPQRITDGPFHDIDPAEMPDGRIVFTSTRIGRFEEYHNPPSRALFVMNPDGSDIHPITNTFIFDNEPEILADGRIIFIRSDNFFDRGKVETLLHAIHPDGTEGYTEIGLDIGPDYGGRLRAFNCGSPAPMPDGRIAFVNGSTITVARLGSVQRDWQNLRVESGDVAALPDGRLFCTLPQKTTVEVVSGKNKRVFNDFNYQKLGVLDPASAAQQVAVIYASSGPALHSPVFLGARTRPPVLPEKVDRKKADAGNGTGILFCQNARYTKNTTAGWPHVRAMRVLAGHGLTTRSSHSYIVHAGSDVEELGTVPLAPDGSFAVEVPADTAIAFQAVDAEGHSELNEMSWIFVRPGETRGCVGCHQTRQAAPTGAAVSALAMRASPVKLLGNPQANRFRGNNPAVTGLMELQFDRFREIASLNRHSDTAQPLATGAQEVTSLIAQLQDGTAASKQAAAQRLGIFRSRSAAPALAELLRDKTRETRLAGAVALAECGTRESVPALLAALSDRDPVVAQQVAVTLENLTGHTQAFNAFGESDEREPQTQAWREWIQKTSWDAIEQDLVRRLNDADRDVVRVAAVALGHVGSERGAEALRAYVVKNRDDNPLPEWRKTHHGDGARFNSLERMNPRTLQAATRALGFLKNAASVPLLAETLVKHADVQNGNLFLAEAAAEALGRIGTPEAESALISAFSGLKEYQNFSGWYGDHGALIACHASPVHYLIIEALDAMGSTRAGSIVPHIIRSVPTDPDRALMLYNDDYETIAGRVIRRGGSEAALVGTCLAILGDAQAAKTPEIEQALGTVHQAWGGRPGPEIRAAQILSLACRDGKYEPAIRAAFDRFRAQSVDIKRCFDTGIPVVNKMPIKHWVCFFLARELGNLAQPASTDALIDALKSPTEAAGGSPDPLGPGVLFLHNDLTPCWRAASAWALGRVGSPQAAPALLDVIADLKNATDTRYAAAEALPKVAGADAIERIQKLAQGYPEVSTRLALLHACEKIAAKK